MYNALKSSLNNNDNNDNNKMNNNKSNTNNNNNNKSNNNFINTEKLHDYANQHIPAVLYRTYDNESKHHSIQMLHDGSQLTVENLVDKTNSLSIHLPILVTDTPESIGMKVPKGKTTTKTKKGQGHQKNHHPTTTTKASATKASATKASATSNTNTSCTTTLDTTTTSNTSRTKHKETKAITISEIGALIGMSHAVSVMDVKTQDELDGWIVSDLVEYFEDEDRLYQIKQQQYNRRIQAETQTTKLKSERRLIIPIKKTGVSKPRVLNQISLEFSNTKLRHYTMSPSFVRELDWIDNVWPKDRRYDESGNDTYPRVQYYCLTSTAGCYTDFHIDFGGTSVWYHILSGQKVFLLIPPSEEHVSLYETWLCSKDQPNIFFPDMKVEVDQSINTERKGKKSKKGEETNEDITNTLEKSVKSCMRVTLEQHQTLIIPTGWIHAVYTPVDSIVIGGNFLHGLDIKGQLEIHCLETRTRVPAKFRFPFFVQLMFYAGKEYYRRMAEPSGVVYNEEVDGIEKLIEALRSWAVGPGGDAYREGSVAHAMVECIHDLESYGISDVEGLLKGLESLLKHIRENGSEKNSVSSDQENIGENKSSTVQSNAMSPSKHSKLILSFKRQSPKTEVEGNNKSHSSEPLKPKRLKIGDLASKHTVDDEDEWLPNASKVKKGGPRKTAKVKQNVSQKKVKCTKLLVTKTNAKDRQKRAGSAKSRLRNKLGMR